MTTTPASGRPTHDFQMLDHDLLENWQRDFPLVARPFAIMGRALGVTEDVVLARLQHLQDRGAVARVGGVVRPNTLGASTLAAVAAPELDVEAVAELLAAISGINHVYLRENAVNLWFVVTGPDLAHVEDVLRAVEERTGLAVLDLRLEEAFHIDLGFKLGGGAMLRYRNVASPKGTHDFACDSMDRVLAQALTDGLPLVERPFDEIGRRLSLSEIATIDRIDRMHAAGILPRIGVIVRHRALGWRSNAMVVWDLAPDRIAAAGAALAEVPGINLCYRRTRYAQGWPFNLYCMVHGRSRDEARDILDLARTAAGLGDVPMQILFSLRCFKQTGALIQAREAA